MTKDSHKIGKMDYNSFCEFHFKHPDNDEM